MKTWKIFFLLALLGCVGNLHAQLLVNSKNTEKKLPFGQSLPALRQASDLIVKASIPKIKKPFVVQLEPAAQLQKAKDQCALLQDQTPTLRLEGERSTTNMVKLDWETTNGRNNQSFLIQRSLGDTFHFETVNSIWAKQRAGLKDVYHQPDENDYNQVSYYRVKLQLRDGTWLFSNIAPVKGYETNRLKLYPNPASGLVMISLYSDQKGNATIKTLDAAGKVVVQQTEFLEAGVNNRELNVSRLTSGFYTVNVLMPDKTEQSVRLIRQ